MAATPGVWLQHFNTLLRKQLPSRMLIETLCIVSIGQPEPVETDLLFQLCGSLSYRVIPATATMMHERNPFLCRGCLCMRFLWHWVCSMGQSPPIHPPAVEKLFVCFCAVFFLLCRRYRRLLWAFVSRFFQGQKPGLTDVQAELDRMTRKQDSVVSTNNVPPPTGNEAWRQHWKKQNHAKKTTKNKNTAASSTAFILWSNTCTFKRKTLTKLC